MKNPGTAAVLSLVIPGVGTNLQWQVSARHLLVNCHSRPLDRHRGNIRMGLSCYLCLHRLFLCQRTARSIAAKNLSWVNQTARHQSTAPHERAPVQGCTGRTISLSRVKWKSSTIVGWRPGCSVLSSPCHGRQDAAPGHSLCLRGSVTFRLGLLPGGIIGKR